MTYQQVKNLQPGDSIRAVNGDRGEVRAIAEGEITIRWITEKGPRSCSYTEGVPYEDLTECEYLVDYSRRGRERVARAAFASRPGIKAAALEASRERAAIVQAAIKASKGEG